MLVVRGGEDNDLYFFFVTKGQFLKSLEKGEAIHDGHVQVEQDHVGQRSCPCIIIVQEFERLTAIFGGMNFVRHTGHSENFRVEKVENVVVVNQKDVFSKQVYKLLIGSLFHRG